MYEYSSFVCMSHILRLSGCTRWLVADIFNTYVCRCASASTVSTLFLHFKVPCRPSSLDLSHTHTAIHAGTLWRCNVNGPVAWSPESPVAAGSPSCRTSCRPPANAMRRCCCMHIRSLYCRVLFEASYMTHIHSYVDVWQFLRVAFSCVSRHATLAASDVSKTFRRSNSL